MLGRQNFVFMMKASYRCTYIVHWTADILRGYWNKRKERLLILSPNYLEICLRAQSYAHIHCDEKYNTHSL